MCSLEERWGALCVAAEDEVNILMSGYSFCLRIMHEKGLSMLQTQGLDAETAIDHLYIIILIVMLICLYSSRCCG